MIVCKKRWKKKKEMWVLADNNKLKTEYIKKSVDNGMKVLADKLMICFPDMTPSSWRVSSPDN